jgi:protein SERAC1
MAYSPSRTSKSIQHVHSIYVSTFGILFLGTPHDGGNKAQLASVSRRMIGTLVPSKVVDTEGQLLDAMQEGSEVLQNITDMFVPLIKDFHIFFWEQEKTNMGVTQDYVRQSSPLDRDFRWRESEAPVARSTRRAERLVPRDFERVVG